MDTITLTDLEITVNGREYHVAEAVVETAVEAVGYEFDPRAFVGRDEMAEVPQEIVSMHVENFDEEKAMEPILIADAAGIREAVMEAASEKCKTVGFGRWM